ncbi:Kelch repeat-containing protein [[Eubacterium] cellulosolvens]
MSDKSGKTKLETMMLIILLIAAGLLMFLQSIPDKDLASAESTWTQTSDDDFTNGTFNNIVLNGTGEAAKLEMGSCGASKWIDKTPTPRPAGYPSQRYDHQMVTIGTTDKVFMFGHTIYSNKENESWVYDLSDNKWTFMQPANNPHIMKYPKIASVWTDDKVVLFGGCGGSGKDNNETWVYDLSDNRWQNKSLLNPTPTTYPSTRYTEGFTSIWGTDKVMIFGGKNFPTYYNDIWIYDVSANSWIEKKPTGVKPSPRTYISMAPIAGTDKVLMFGGNYSQPMETWVYDLSDNKWTKMMKLPSTLRGSEFAPICGTNKVLFFGGWTTWYSNETWIFDLNGGPQGGWENITHLTPLLFRYRHGMASVDNTNKIVLFGGAIGQNPWSSDDTWVFEYRFNATNGNYTSEPFDTGSNSTFYSISRSAGIPAGTQLRIQLRTALDKDGLNLQPFVGPEGKSNKYYTGAVSDIWTGHHGHRWLQYKVIFDKTNISNSPTLKDIIITYNCLPETIVLSPTNGSVLTTNKPTFDWKFQDYDSEQQKAFQLVIDDDLDFESVDFNSGEQLTADEQWEFPMSTGYTEIPDGCWYWRIRTQDDDDVWTEYSGPQLMIIDAHTPNSTLEVPINNTVYNFIPEIAGTASDPPGGTGLAKIEVAVERLNDNYHWDGTKWVSAVTWLLATGSSEWSYDASSIQWTSGSQYTVRARATDFAANIEVPEVKILFTMDMDYPTSTIITPPENKWLNNVDIISGNAVDTGGAGIDGVEVCIKWAGTNKYWYGTYWSSGVRWLDAAGTELWSYDTASIQWDTGNEYVIFSRAIDQTGNLEQTGSGRSFKYDAIAPDQLKIQINQNDKYTTSNTVILSVHGVDIGAGISEMAFSGDGETWTEWESFSTTKEFELSQGDGEKVVYFRLRDHAGNIAEPVFDKIVLDTEPPEEVFISINDGDEFTNSDSLNLAISAVDSISGINSITFSFDSVNWQPWEPFDNSKTFYLPAGTFDGNIPLYLRVRDNAGNIAEPVYDSIMLDKTPPHGLSALINGGAYVVKSTEISLELYAVDYLSGVHQMSFSTDGETWSSWEPFAGERAYNLSPTDGKKVIYFRVSDRAGNIAEPISSMVMLNITSSEPSDTGSDSGDDTNGGFEGLLLLFISVLIVVIIILLVVFLAIIRKRRKRAEQEVLRNGAVTVKPRSRAPFAGSASNSITPKLAQLPSTPEATSNIGLTQPRAPTLADSQSATQVPAPQPVPQVPAAVVPKLPPANIDTDKPEDDQNISITKKPTVAHTPSPTLATASQTIPTVSKTPTLAQTSENHQELKVHLPDSEPSPQNSKVSPTTTQEMIQNIKKTND